MNDRRYPTAIEDRLDQYIDSRNQGRRIDTGEDGELMELTGTVDMLFEHAAAERSEREHFPDVMAARLGESIRGQTIRHEAAPMSPEANPPAADGPIHDGRWDGLDRLDEAVASSRTRQIAGLAAGIAGLIALTAVLTLMFGVGEDPGMSGPGAVSDGDLILFSAGDTQSQDIFLVDPDSGDRTNLTDNEFSDLMPAWSPDGTRIAFYSNRDGEDERWFDLYVMDPDGSNVQRVAEGRFNATTPPAWSPNGDEIAAIWIGESPEAPNSIAELRAITVETGDSHTVYAVENSGGAQANLLGPISWSSDGQRIAVYQFDPGAVSGTALVHVERGFESLVEHAHDARWSPVENRLAYIQDGGRDDNGLYVTAADGSDPLLLVPAPDDTTIGSLAWSPDGDRLLASMSTTMPLTSIDLVEIDAENGDVRWLDVVDEEHPVAGYANWSPDMDEIVYVASYFTSEDGEESREVELRVIRSDGEVEALMSAERINPPQWRSES